MNSDVRQPPVVDNERERWVSAPDQMRAGAVVTVVDHHDTDAVQRPESANAVGDQLAVGKSQAVPLECPEIRSLRTMQAIAVWIMLALDRPNSEAWSIEAQGCRGGTTDPHCVLAGSRALLCECC